MSRKGIGLSIIKKLLIETKDIKVLGISRNINKNIDLKIQKDFQIRFIFYERDICDHQEIYKFSEHEQKKYISNSFAI